MRRPMGAICAVREDREQVLRPTLAAQAEGVAQSSDVHAGARSGVSRCRRDQAGRDIVNSHNQCAGMRRRP